MPNYIKNLIKQAKSNLSDFYGVYPYDNLYVEGEKALNVGLSTVLRILLGVMLLAPKIELNDRYDRLSCEIPEPK